MKLLLLRSLSAACLLLAAAAACSGSTTSSTTDAGADTTAACVATCAHLTAICGANAGSCVSACPAWPDYLRACVNAVGTCDKGLACLSVVVDGGSSGSSGSSGASGTSSSSGTSGASGTSGSAGALVLQGQVVDLASSAGISAGTVAAGANTALSDLNGRYKLAIGPGALFNLRVEKTGYYTLLEQEAKLGAAADLGRTTVISENTANLILSTLSGNDGASGIISVLLMPTTCASEEGATIDVTVDGQPSVATKVVYTSSGFPDIARKAAQAGSVPQALLYNFPVGKSVTVTARHPSCTMSPFPVDVPIASGTITYTSATLVPLGGKSTGTLRIFLQ